jgi:hypothetical protein
MENTVWLTGCCSRKYVSSYTWSDNCSSDRTGNVQSGRSRKLWEGTRRDFLSTVKLTRQWRPGRWWPGVTYVGDSLPLWSKGRYPPPFPLFCDGGRRDQVPTFTYQVKDSLYSTFIAHFLTMGPKGSMNDTCSMLTKPVTETVTEFYFPFQLCERRGTDFPMSTRTSTVETLVLDNSKRPMHSLASRKYRVIHGHSQKESYLIPMEYIRVFKTTHSPCGTGNVVVYYKSRKRELKAKLMNDESHMADTGSTPFFLFFYVCAVRFPTSRMICVINSHI